MEVAVVVAVGEDSAVEEYVDVYKVGEEYVEGEEWIWVGGAIRV